MIRRFSRDGLTSTSWYEHLDVEAALDRLREHRWNGKRSRALREAAHAARRLQ